MELREDGGLKVAVSHKLSAVSISAEAKLQHEESEMAGIYGSAEG
jgi:hypothetical protein